MEKEKHNVDGLKYVIVQRVNVRYLKKVFVVMQHTCDSIVTNKFPMLACVHHDLRLCDLCDESDLECGNASEKISSCKIQMEP